MQESTNNHALFADRPTPPEEATRSWWMDAPRAGFTRTAEDRELRRMQRSDGAKKVRVYTIGWAVSGRKS